MSEILRRDDEFGFPYKISEILKSRISEGIYASGMRLPSVRDLAREFSVSPVTVVKAMDLLEPTGAIRRTPGKGVFAAIPENSAGRKLRVAFAFPPEKFEPQIVGVESWALAAEFHRGLLAGAAKFNSEVSFLQFPYQWSDADLERFRTQLAPYDLVVFVNGALTPLANAIGERQLVLCLNHQGGLDMGDRNRLIDYDRKQAVELLVDYAVERQLGSVGAVAFKQDVLRGKDRAQHFLNACAARGLSVCSEHYWLVDFDRPDWTRELTAVMRRANVPRLIYCDHSDLVPKLYNAAPRCGLTIGKDFRVVAISSGAMLVNLDPPCDYVRVPRFEMGYGVMSIVTAALRERRNFTLPLFPASLATQSI